MKVKQGKIKYIKLPSGNKPMGISIEGIWYNSFEKEHQNVGEGDLVELVYETNEKGFNNINSLRIIDKIPPPSPIVNEDKYKEKYWENKELKIVRQNSLTQANEMLKTLQAGDRLKDLNNEQVRELLFRIADQCEDWVYR